MAKKLMSPQELCSTRMRWVHLDFHTSPLIKDVGVEFDPDEFAKTLVDARVNLITLFGKCHHGMSYYPTKVGTMHPGLKFDLLGEQIKACRKHNIVTPVYISIKVDQHIAQKNLGWVNRIRDGRPWGPSSNDAGWYNLCPNNTEYVDYLEAQAVEVMKKYDPAGIFFDMCYYSPYPGCFCERCLERMKKEGFDRSDDVRHRDMEFRITREYTTRLAKAVRKIKPNATLFFNSRVTPTVGRELDVLTHLEIESLPTIPGWGYFFFPFMVRMARTTGRPTIGQTARFHKSWGDFGSIKTVDQLEYEMGTILSAGSSMGIGDQLHPRGKLDKGVYEVIGETYKQIEQREPWCIGAKPLSEVAVLMMPEPPAGILIDSWAVITGMAGSSWDMNESNEGAGRMLREIKLQWNVETPDGDFSQYKVLVLPDRGILNAKLQKKLSDFLKDGGSIILSNEATLDKENKKFLCPGVPVEYVKPCEFTPSFMRLGKELGKELVETDFVMYDASSYVKPLSGTKAMGHICSSYFNRDYNHYTSHSHSPVDRVLQYPVAVRKNRVVYVSAPIFQAYKRYGFFVYKKIFENIMEMLLSEPLIKAEAPSSMEINILRQPKENRLVVHLVNYQPQRRHAEIEYIEKNWPVRNITLKVLTGKKPNRVYLAPQQKGLPVKQEGNYTIITIPEVKSHQMVVFE